MRPRTVVVTENHAHFRAWCINNSLSPRDRTLINVTRRLDLQKVQGLHGFGVIWYTIPRDRAEYEYIHCILTSLSQAN